MSRPGKVSRARPHARQMRQGKWQMPAARGQHPAQNNVKTIHTRSINAKATQRASSSGCRSESSPPPTLLPCIRHHVYGTNAGPRPMQTHNHKSPSCRKQLHGALQVSVFTHGHPRRAPKTTHGPTMMIDSGCTPKHSLALTACVAALPPNLTHTSSRFMSVPCSHAPRMQSYASAQPNTDV
jgi:hypothetical protein